MESYTMIQGILDELRELVDAKYRSMIEELDSLIEGLASQKMMLIEEPRGVHRKGSVPSEMSWLLGGTDYGFEDLWRHTGNTKRDAELWGFQYNMRKGVGARFGGKKYILSIDKVTRVREFPEGFMVLPDEWPKSVTVDVKGVGRTWEGIWVRRDREERDRSSLVKVPGWGFRAKFVKFRG